MEKAKGKATVVITYNSVSGYKPGVHQGRNGPVVIYSHNNYDTWDTKAPQKLGEIMHQLYGRINPEDVEKVYLYVGRYAMDGALRAAKQLASDGNKLELVACDCNAGIKKRTAQQIGAPIIWADCGGFYTLGEIVNQLVKKETVNA
jgi:hypothetical protein